MKTVSRIVITATVTVAVILLPSCASLRQPPDPGKIQLQIAAAREKEIALVQATVADPVRADRLVGLLAERDRMVERHVKALIAHREKLMTLTADYDARREDFEALLAELNRKRAAAQKETIDLVAAMKAATTAEEWKTIAGFQLKRLNPRQLTYGQAASGS